MDTSDENSFDPTPKLTSNPIPVLFIPLNHNESKCNYCESKYSVTQLLQKYCKSCLFQYIKLTTGSNTADTYLDVHIKIRLGALSTNQLLE